MNKSELKSLIKESIKEVLKENQELETKINSFVKSGEDWSDSDYEEIEEMSSGLAQKNPKVQTAYKLIRSLTGLTQEERLKKISTIKSRIKSL
jgi:DNA-binding transcriptional regulator GbsR (MarR family)